MEEVFRDYPDTAVPEADEIATDEEWQEIEQSPARFEEMRRAFGLHPKDDGTEPSHEPVVMLPIPPYEYPTPPVARSSPGDTQEKPKPVQVQPYQRPPTKPKPFIQSTPPKVSVPEQPVQQVSMSHPETVTLPPTQEVQQYKKPAPEVQKSKPEVRTSQPSPTSTSGSKPVQKSTDPVEKDTAPVIKATGKGKIKKLDEYDGQLGRKHSEKQIEEILDVYLQTGLLPTYVTQKMRWLYKHHRRLPERRELLEQAGKPIVVPETGGDANNVIPMERTDVRNQKRTS